MAQFNPDIPKEQLPNYWYWSRPIQQPTFAAPQGNKIPVEIHADTSKAEAIKGIGDIAGSAIKGTDAYLSMYSKDIASNAAEGIRDEATADVESKTGGPSLLADDRAPLPDHIQGALDKAKPLQDAQDSGKLPSDTYYKMRLAASQKDLRSSVPPGYWPDIDRGFEETTGMNPANAYLAAKMRDLHTMMTANDKDKQAIDKILTDMYAGGNENASHIMNARKAGAGLSDADTRAWIARENANEHRLKTINDQYAIREREGQMNGNGDLLTTLASRDTIQYAHNRASSYYDTRQLLMDASTGRHLDLDDPKDRALYAQNIDAKQREFERDIDDYGNQAVYTDQTGNKRTRRDILGDTAFDNVKKSALSRFEADKRFVTDQGLQAGTYWRQAVEGAEAEAKMSVYNNKSIGEMSKMAFGFNHWFGAEWMRDYAKTALQARFPQAVNTWAGVDTIQTGAATPEEPWVSTQTFKSAYQDGFRDPGFYSWILNNKIYGGLLNPQTTDEGKRQFIDHFFLPQNSKFLSLISPGGQTKVFNQLSQPAVTDQVFAVGKPDQQINYKNSVEGWFKTTTGTNIETVNDAVKGEKSPIPLIFHYNDKLHEFSITDEGGRILSLNADREYFDKTGRLNTPYIAALKKTVTELNRGLSNLGYVYSKEPAVTAEEKHAKVNSHIFDTLQAIGFDINPEKITGLPAEWTAAVEASRPKKPQQHANPIE